MSTTNATNNAQLPPGTKTIWVFDTNAYIDLAQDITLEECRSRADEMRSSAHQGGEAIFASPIVIWELVTNLADPNAPSYKRSMKALVFLAHHCAAWNVDDHRIQMIPFGSALTCHALFGRASDNDTGNAGALSQLAYQVRLDAPDLSDPVFMANAAEFAKVMDSKEQSWVVDMKQLGTFLGASATTELDARQEFFKEESFWPRYCRDIVDRHAASISAVQSEEDAQGRAKFLQERFESNYRMFSGLMSKMLAPAGINVESKKRKWWNFIWDEDLCWTIGPAHAIGGSSVHVVTTDGAFHIAATEANCADRVVTLDAYRSTRGL